MEEQAILELIDRLSDEGRVFHYFKDRYALMLLSWFVEDGRTVRDLKSSRFRGLLDKPVVKSVTRAHRDGVITREALQRTDAAEPAGYRITYDLWGELYGENWWCQTSRPGMNLVLQVNFPDEHDFAYAHLLRAEKRMPFVTCGHPVRAGQYNTMGWARIDIDFEAGEALIEEIQNDWIRAALAYEMDARVAVAEERKSIEIWGSDGLVLCRAKRFVSYIDDVLSAYDAIWAEVILAAALDFLVGRIGIRRIFYHTFDGGNRLKRMDDPPRSLYTTLPRKFCFREVDDSPRFLEKPIDPSEATVQTPGGKMRRVAGTIVDESEESDQHEHDEPVRFHLLEL